MELVVGTWPDKKGPQLTSKLWYPTASEVVTPNSGPTIENYLHQLRSKRKQLGLLIISFSQKEEEIFNSKTFKMRFKILYLTIVKEDFLSLKLTQLIFLNCM